MKTTIIVQNLKCGGCANTIITKIGALPNITDVTVDNKNAAVSFESVQTEDVLLVKEKLKSLGYPSIEENNNVVSKAKSFVSCATGKLSN
ncbi:MAG: heavy-metal-associated domain-containing protein [Nonlabens sp.]|uniref:heavy-metal-associated domain-containing protein n=1 Tax=Nonlabens sp. TaxID=1888209 RepID=UPI003EF38BA7